MASTSVGIDSKELLSATELSKNTKHVLNMLEEHKNERYFILRNNKPKAVLISMEEYEELIESIEDHSLLQLALERTKNTKLEDYLTEGEITQRVLNNAK